MKREVVRDFLNLPGIVGIALMDGRSRPFFLGIDQILNFQQKEALSQGIQQVVETTPANFEFFEFQFSGYRAYIYKLANDVILLVLTNNALVYANFSLILSLLRDELQEDTSNAIANFRLAAGNVTLSGQSYWKRESDTSDTTAASSTSMPSSSDSGPVPSSPPLESASASSPSTINGHGPAPPPPRTQQSQKSAPTVPPPPSKPAASSPPSPKSPSGASRSSSQARSSRSAKKPADSVSNGAKTGNTADTAASPTRQVSLKDMLVALNELSKTTTHYLGATIVSNYWKSSRPAVEWLSYLEVDRAGQITCSTSMPAEASQPLTPEQLKWLREWVEAFIKKCSRVIRDFPSVIQKMELNANQRSLLLPDKR